MGFKKLDRVVLGDCSGGGVRLQLEVIFDTAPEALSFAQGVAGGSAAQVAGLREPAQTEPVVAPAEAKPAAKPRAVKEAAPAAPKAEVKPAAAKVEPVVPDEPKAEPAKAAAPKAGAADPAVEVLAKASGFRAVMDYFMIKESLREIDPIVVRCKQVRDQVPVIERVGDDAALKDRVERSLQALLPMLQQAG